MYAAEMFDDIIDLQISDLRRKSISDLLADLSVIWDVVGRARMISSDEYNYDSKWNQAVRHSTLVAEEIERRLKNPTALIEVQLQHIADNTLELVKRVPREVRYIGEGFMSTEGLPATKINTHLNEIRRILRHE